MRKVFVALSLLVGCANHQGKDAADIPTPPLSVKYENEYFSLRHPKGWTAVWEDYDPEAEVMVELMNGAGLRGGSVKVTSPDGRCMVKIVKSTAAQLLPLDITPRVWCGFSQLGREMEDECVGSTDIVDSLAVDGFPAAMVGFVYVYGRDTVIMEQHAIVPARSDLYYANVEYPKDDLEARQTGREILGTLHIKTEGK